MYDALWCAFDNCVMGQATERYANEAAISRQRQDEIAAASHERAASAWAAGRLADEVVSLEIEQDEGIRVGTTTEKLAGLKAVFGGQETITAGNSSQISDGAAAAVLMTAEQAQHRGLTPLAEIVAYGQVAGPTPSLLHQPSNAIRAALAKADLNISDLALIEINEAFAAVSAASIADLGVSDDIVNVNGGAIAIGHPVGMTGARITMTLIHELRRRGGGYGAAALCGGGGQGDAIIVKV
jgi:acetyl-CoA C-acetyltransferase